MSLPGQWRCTVADLSPTLRAVLRAPRPLQYTRVPGIDDGLPQHVRAASAARRRGNRLVIVQDDVLAFALLDAAGCVLPLGLPAGPGGQRVFDTERGNKHLKPDLEAAVVFDDGTLVAFGSGSTPERERIVILGPGAGAVPRVVPWPGLYGSLRSLTDMLGAPLNIEGVVVQGDRLRFLQRGNGARGSGGIGANAILDVSLAEFRSGLHDGTSAPGIVQALAVDLGDIDGVPFGFTDAALDEHGRLAFLACAEDSADVVSDGPVRGCRFGWIDGEDVRMTDVVEPEGRTTHFKLEGIELRPGGTASFDVVADMDRPDEPAVIAELWVSVS